MVKRTGAGRRKSRHKLSKNAKDKGKISLTKYFQKFNIDDRVILKADPAVQKGMYHVTFHGKSGLIKTQKGACYEVEIKDGGKLKTVIVHPIHLKQNQ